MGENSGISWTDDTFNVWWGCMKVSEGCENCYAEELAVNRRKLPIWGPRADRRFFGDVHWNDPKKWNRQAQKAGVPRRVFCSSMADVFERHADAATDAIMRGERAKLWNMIWHTPWLDWLLLTKRPQNIRAMLPPQWLEHPMPNVWLGTTAENQARAHERIPELLAVPAAVRFVSVEPQIERIELNEYIDAAAGPCGEDTSDLLDWVICGGESGRSARPFALDWARALRDECAATDTAFFMKQFGSSVLVDPPNVEDVMALAGGRGKHDDPAHWPADLRVQQFPRTAERPFATEALQ